VAAISNELTRWADPQQVGVWTEHNKFMLERVWWLEVMRAQKDLGVSIPQQAIDDYAEASCKLVNLESIRQRETVTRHDVKARLEEFNSCAGGWQHAHKGMTGRDLDDNVELIQAKRGLELLGRQARRAGATVAADRLTAARDRLPLRGIWGPVGTGADMVDLLGSRAALDQLNRRMASEFEFRGDQVLDSVGQVYPRSIDHGIGLDVMAALLRTRIEPGWLVLVRGYLRMLGELAGGQWLEGDVSCSVVRRVAVANLFLAASAALNSLNDTYSARVVGCGSLGHTGGNS
jgi:adenylosuccinate lyase